MSLLQRKAFVGSFPLCAKRLVCRRCLVGERSASGEITYADEDRFNQLFTVGVSVQRCFSECYFEIGNTIVEMFRAEPQFCVVCAAFGSSYCINQMGGGWKFTSLQGGHLFKNNCELNQKRNKPLLNLQGKYKEETS